VIAAVLDAVRAVLGEAREPVPLHEPEFAGNEWTYVRDCIDSGWVSSVGEYVDRFERELCALTGAAHAVAVVNGSASLHLSLLLAGVRAGDEVIVPALTFVATANAVAHCGAVPHFADSAVDTLGVDVEKLAAHLDAIAETTTDGLRNRETGRRIAAVMCTHVFGHPVALDPLVELCARHGLPLVEDAAEALGSTYKGAHVGTQGTFAALSFNGNKVVTTGGGGAVLTQDAELGRRAKHLSTQAKTPHPWAFMHDAVGFNHRLPNINAALGCAQLEQLPGLLARKRQLAERYAAVFAAIPGVQVVPEPAGCRSNNWLNALLLDADDLRDPLLQALHDAKVLARPAWEPMHHLPMYRDCPRAALDVAESLCRRLVNLPSSAALAPRED
jgi:perosamine synthetase